MNAKEELTTTQKVLILGLRRTSLTSREQAAILAFTEENVLWQMELIHYMTMNPKASAQDILNHLWKTMQDERFRAK